MKRNNLTTSVVAGLAAIAGIAAVAAQPNICRLYEHDGRSSGRSPTPHKPTGAAKIQRDAKKKRNKKR